MENHTFSMEELNSHTLHSINSFISTSSSSSSFPPELPPTQITINRPVLLTKDVYPTSKRQSTSWLSPFSCHPSHLTLSQFLSQFLLLLTKCFPILDWLPNYSFRQNLLADLWSGLTLACSHISDGLAFSWLAGLPPVNGLYMAIFPVLVYAILGRSRQLSIGTFPVLSIVCNQVLGSFEGHLATGDNSTSEIIISGSLQVGPSPLEILTSLALLVGLLQVLIGILRLEALFSLLSETILAAFMTALPLHILINQLFPLFGIVNPQNSGLPPFTADIPFKFLQNCLRFMCQLTSVNPVAASLAFGCVVVIWVCKAILEPSLRRRYYWMKSIYIPINLMLILGITFLCHYFTLASTYRLQTIPHVHSNGSLFSLPLSLPKLTLWPSLLSSALLFTFVTFSSAYTTGRAYAKKHDYRLIGAQEMIALGVANTVASFFHCYPCAPSGRRTRIQDRIGQTSQLASLVSVVLVVLFAHFAFKYFTAMPVFVLSAIIFTSTLSLLRLKITEITRIFHFHSRADSATWVITFLGILLFGAKWGLFAGIALSLIFVFRKITRPALTIKHSLANSDVYLPEPKVEPSHQITVVKSNCLIFEISGPLIYLNVEHLKHRFSQQIIETIKCNRSRQESIYTLSSLASSSRLTPNGATSSAVDLTLNFNNNNPATPSPTSGVSSIHTVILDCSAVCFVDARGSDLLSEFQVELGRISSVLKLSLASCSAEVVDSLQLYGFFKKFDIARCFCTVHDAVASANAASRAFQFPLTYQQLN